MSFEFGIFDSFDLGTTTAGELIQNRLSLAVEAERLGFDHYHATEHHGTELSVIPSPNIFLSALSQRTTRMRFGAMVYVLPTYEPLRLAEEIAVIDQLSGGRLDIGIGSGVNAYELGYFGVPAEEARNRYERVLPALLEAWQTGVFAHPDHPEREAATLSVLPAQRPYPPLWYASSNQRTATWAGAHGVNFLGRWNGGEFVGAVEAYWEAWLAARDDTGRLNGHVPSVPRVGPTVAIVIGDTDQQARERFDRAQDFFWKRVTKLGHDHDDHRNDAAFRPETMIANGAAIVGTAASVRDQIVAQVEQADINMVEVQLYSGDMSFEESRANLQAFASIMPEIRAGGAAAATTNGRVALAMT